MRFEFYVLAVCVCFGSAITDEKWRCITPNGEDGQCVSLYACPPIMKAFANPKKATEDYLRKFYCLYDEPILVCCGLSSNFTVYNTTTSNSDIENSLKKMSDLRFCGYQRADDYFQVENIRTADEYPWLALIILPPYHWGAGTLINRRYVLTSRAANAPLNNLAHPLIVRLGEFNILNDTDCVKLPSYDEECNSYKLYSVEEVITHPFTVTYHAMHFITLLRLNGTVEFTDYIRPICLPIPGIPAPKPGDVVQATGWGGTDTYEAIITKKKIFNVVISDDECKEKRAKYNSILTEYHMCTVVAENQSETVCHGDSGAPIMFSHKHQWFLEGIALFIKQGGTCTTDEPTVHIKVANYLEWMQQTIRP